MSTCHDSEQKMIDLYQAGKSQREIAKIFSHSQTGVSLILLRNGIKTRVGKSIIYADINTSFFKEINCEANAYFLGLLYADGNVQNYATTLKLKDNDRFIIEKFRDIMSPSSPIKKTKNKELQTEYAYFRINRKEVCDQLISHGCVPKKSLILKFPTTVPNNLIRHFLRGYSDGDGSIYKNKNKHTAVINTIWKIVSTKDFCNEVSILLKKELNCNSSQSLSAPSQLPPAQGWWLVSSFSAHTFG